MNTLDRLLQDEMNRFLDRLAATAPEGVVAAVSEREPALHARLGAAEARLTGLRAALLENYRQWRETMDDCQDLWALAAMKAGEALAPAERRAA